MSSNIPIMGISWEHNGNKIITIVIMVIKCYNGYDLSGNIVGVSEWEYHRILVGYAAIYLDIPTFMFHYEISNIDVVVS